MASADVTYNSVTNEGNPFKSRNEEIDTSDVDTEDTPGDSGIMIHVVPETSKARWNHIEDLDSFFTRMYYYHQRHGFTVIFLEEVFQLGEFAFVVWLVTFMTHCVKYPVLFGENNNNNTKVGIPDVLVPVGQCILTFSAFTYIVLFAASLLFFLRLVKVLYHIAQYWDIKKFYNTALKIDDNHLDNITWHEVQKKIREVQSEQQMCIHKEQLTELDIYHRILRFKNYMVALMNKNLLPVRFCVPFFGEVVSLSRGLLYNIELILFRGPWSPFENNWQLRGDLTVRSNRTELARKLSRQIMWIAAANFLLSPIVFLWQLTYISFSYATILRREPGSLGVRTWSNYGRLYLRHFNELDHELDARLNRAYEPADKYMSSFSSPVMTVIAKNILFVCGGVLVVILLLGVYEEHVFQVDHVLTIATALTGIGMICRVLIPDENLIWCPEQLLTAVLAHVHYLPTEWRGLAHTSTVRKEFGHFFQFKAVYTIIKMYNVFIISIKMQVYLVNELISPIITPFILMYVFRPRALDIVDFFRSFTVSVVGVGNVCSFAQMDVRKHGNPDWQLTHSIENMPSTGDNHKVYVPKQMEQGEHGKTELSLIHFTLTNPEWKMPVEAKYFMEEIKQHALQDLIKTKTRTRDAQTNTAMAESLMSFGSIAEEYSSIAQSVLQDHHMTTSAKVFGAKNIIGHPSASFHAAGTSHGYDFEHMLQQNLYDGSTTPTRGGFLQNIQENEAEVEGDKKEPEQQSLPSYSIPKCVRKMRVRKSEGRLEGPSEGLLYSIYGLNDHLTANPTDITTADMCLSTLYLHELHRRQVQKKSARLAQSQRIHWQQSHRPYESHTTPISTIVTKVAESTPLLPIRKS